MKKRIASFIRINRKFLIAVIALLEVGAIFCAVTFSWIEGSNQGALRDNISTVSAGEGLYFTDLGGNIIDSVTLLDRNVELQECSSLDGRNFFFPTSESVKSDTVTKMVYRAGTDADKNTKYVSKDFHVVSYSQAKLYIDDVQSSVTCDNLDIKKALRISLNFNDGKSPILLCGAPEGYSRQVSNSSPVTEISSEGFVTSSGGIVAHTFGEFSVNSGKEVASFDGAETKRVTVSVWLEGTDELCTSDKINDKINNANISIKLVLTTESNYTKEVTFVDHTPNKWISDVPDVASSNIKMFAIDKSTFNGSDYISGKRYSMNKADDGITYTTKLPETVEDVIFARFDPENPDLGYNYWATTQKMGTSNKYYAIGQGASIDSNPKNDAGNYGYWVDEQVPEVIQVELTEAPLKNEIKFTNNYNWGSVYAYFFNGNVAVGGNWPGKVMTWEKKNDYNQDVYKITIPSGATGVTFNGGSGQPQTVDIDLTASDTEGYYLSEDKDSSNKYYVTAYDTTRVDTNATIFSSTYNPNIYFTSAKYGTTLATLTGLTGKNGVFDPTKGFDKSSNYGLNMYKPNADKKVYRMYLPSDAVIKFNGKGNASQNITLADAAGSNKKVGFKFTSATSYTTYN